MAYHDPKLDEATRAEILREAIKGTSQSRLAGMFGVGQSTICRYIDGRLPPSPRRKRYSEETKQVARGLHEQGLPLGEIARRLGIASHSTIRKWIGLGA